MFPSEFSVITTQCCIWITSTVIVKQCENTRLQKKQVRFSLFNSSTEELNNNRIVIIMNAWKIHFEK